MKFNSPEKINSAAILFFLCLTFYYVYPVFFNDSLAFAGSTGDGIGSLGSWGILIEQVNKDLYQLFNDQFYVTSIGFGINEPGNFAIFWKVLIFLFSKLFSNVDDIWDGVVALSFFLHGVLGYFIGKLLKLNNIVNLFLGLAFMHLDVFYYRMDGHLAGLGTYWQILFWIYLVIRSSFRPTYLNLIFLGIYSAIAFNINEYYGYFGVFICFSYYLSYLYFSNQFTLINLSKVFWGAVIFTSCMILLYPTIFSSSVNPNAGFGSPHFHDWGQFQYYILYNVGAYLKPGYEFLANLIPVGWTAKRSWELTSRIGLLLPISILVSVMILRKNKNSKSISTPVINSLGIAAFIAFLFSATTNWPFSLVRLTYKLAPMFRVGVRSMIFVDLILILIFSLLVNEVWKIILKKYYSKKNTLIFVGVLIFIGNDLSFRSWLNRPIINSLPNTSVYKEMAMYGKGSVIELPFFSPEDNNPEGSYPYVYNQSYHGHRLVNVSYTGSRNQKFIKELDYFKRKLYSELINKNTDFLLDLYRSGVKFIVYDKNYFNSVNIYPELEGALKTNVLLQVVNKLNDKLVFKIVAENTVPFNEEDFVIKFWGGLSKFLDFSNTCIESGINSWDCLEGAKLRLTNYTEGDREFKLSMKVNNELKSWLVNLKPFEFKIVNIELNKKSKLENVNVELVNN